MPCIQPCFSTFHLYEKLYGSIIDPLLDTDRGGGGGDRSDENQSSFCRSGKETRSSMTLSQ